MSGSTEIPDIIGGISNTIGLHRLWQTDEQADTEKWKAEREAEETKPADSEEALQTAETLERKEDSGDAVPISAKKEWEKEQKGDTIDHDIEIHGIPRQQTPPTSKGYDWLFPAAQKANQAKMKSDSELNKDESSPPQQSIHRPKTRRESTMPIRISSGGRSETPEQNPKSTARSKWVSATNALRFPLRRRKTEIKPSTGGAGLVATLAAGAPAATLLASHMIADERSHSRIPVIVDLLKVPSPTVFV